MSDSAEVTRLRLEVERLARRMEALAGEVRALRRAADRGGLSSSEMVRRAEAAALLGMQPGTLAAWARDGRGPPYQLFGRRAFYRVTDLDRWRQTAATSGTCVQPGRRADALALPGL